MENARSTLLKEGSGIFSSLVSIVPTLASDGLLSTLQHIFFAIESFTPPTKNRYPDQTQPCNENDSREDVETN